MPWNDALPYCIDTNQKPDAASDESEIAFTPEQVEREIRRWIRTHPKMRLSLFRIDRNDHIAMFNLGGYIRFQLYFKSNWHPLFFSTENADLNQHLTMANMLLSNHGFLAKKVAADKKDAAPKGNAPHAKTENEKLPESSTAESSPAMDIDPTPEAKTTTEEPKPVDFEKIDLSEDLFGIDSGVRASTEEDKKEEAEDEVEIGLGRVFDLIMEGYRSQYNFDLEEDIDDEDDEDEVMDENPLEGTEGEPAKKVEEVEVHEPSAEEWTTQVIPAVRRFMRREGMAPYLMDEWIRRVEQNKTNQGMAKAIATIRDDILSGSAIPRSLRPFIPRRLYDGSANFGEPQPPNGMTQAQYKVQRFMREQWQAMGRRFSPTTGFYARPLKDDMLHWTLTLSNFDNRSHLGMALMELALAHHDFNEKKPSAPSVESTETEESASYTAPPKKVEATNIIIEVLFPDTFDEDEEAIPFFRIIRPTLLDLPDDFFANVFKTFKPKPKPKEEPKPLASAIPTSEVVDLAISGSSTEALTPSSYYAALATSSGGASALSLDTSSGTEAANNSSSTESVEKKPEQNESDSLKISSADALKVPAQEAPATTAHMEVEPKSSWNPVNFDLFDFFNDLRLCLITQQPRVDMNSATTGYQTTGFWKRFRCISAVMAEEERIEGMGKVCLPSSCLELIYGNRASSYMGLSTSGNFAPMTFELSGIDSKVQTYCGVLEFTAQEGTVVVPSWMFEMLHFQEGELVMMRQITLPPGEFVKLQPLDDSYAVEGVNPKALLEWRLRDFVALTKGEILPIIAHGHTFRFSVLDVRPGHSIAITDRDITVEFVDPLQTTEAPTPSVAPTPAPSANEPVAKSPLKTGHVEGTETTVVDGKKCENCRHIIPHAAYLTHSMRCPRMNYFCESCQTAVPKAEKEAHDAAVHAPAECGRCREKMEVRHLANHAQNLCPARMVKCSFCELNMPASSRGAHEASCGTRTVKCPGCNVRVSVRFLEEHQTSGCSKKEEPRRYGSPSSGTRRNSGPSVASTANSQLFVCETCQEPIDSFDELQVHMLTVHYSDEAAPATEETKEAKVPEE